MSAYQHQLDEVVRSTPWLVAALTIVRDAGPSWAYIAAGAVRDTVWNSLTRRPSSRPTGDIDVVYFDPAEPKGYEHRHEATLNRRLQELRWDLTNQAWVHAWYGDAPGREIRPCQTLSEGVSTWPETATAVAVRLGSNDSLDVVAPLGLDDLFGLVVRHNPVRATATTYLSRIAAKNWATKWPELRILPPEVTPAERG